MDITAESYWHDIAHLVRWLDDNPAFFGDALQWRVGKIVEEVGEAQEALGALAGQNPRKTSGAPAVGALSRIEPLAAELADVIITASVALLTLTPAADRHLAARLQRARARTSTPVVRQGVPS